MGHGNRDWDNNLAKVLIAFFDLIREFKIVASFLILGAAFTLGWLNVPVFETILNGFIALAASTIPRIGG